MSSDEEMSSREQKWSLKGMTALVTGGTRGIGYSIVEELAGFGATIHTCSRNQTELNQRIQEWENKGFKVTGSTCDLTVLGQREELINTVSLLFHGKLNILINNAGSTLLKWATEVTMEDWSHILGTNLESPYHLTQLAQPLLKASGRGSIVFVSSVAGLRALPALSPYASAKAAINQLTKNLACEWGKHNIRVNAVAPWAVKTTITTQEQVDPSISAAFGKMIMQTPLARMAEPEEISSIIGFLCLPAAAYLTGQVICVDGGYTAGAF